MGGVIEMVDMVINCVKSIGLIDILEALSHEAFLNSVHRFHRISETVIKLIK